MSPFRPKLENPFGTTWSSNGVYYADGGGGSPSLAIQQLFVNFELNFAGTSASAICLNIWITYDSALGTFIATGLWVQPDSTQNWQVFANMNTP